MRACAAALLLACACAPVARRAFYKDLEFPPLREFALPPIERVELSNGMILFLAEDHEWPFVEMAAMVRAGSAWEPAEKIGLADLAAEVMRTGGAGALSGDQVDEALEQIAATVSIDIDRIQGSASLSVLKEHGDRALGLFAAILMAPAFAQDKLELAKIRARSEIARRNDDPGGIVAREFSKLMYGAASPYARHPEYATIDAIAREDLVAFHRRFFRPANIMLGVWGDFKKDEMIRKIEAAFGGAKAPDAGGERPEIPSVAAGPEPGVCAIQKEDMNQAFVSLGHLGGRMDDPDRPALIVMNEILGGSFTSRLFTTVRSRMGLAYSVRGQYGAAYAYPGVFAITCQTKSASALLAIGAIAKEIERIAREEVTDQELAEAKDHYLNSFVFNFDTTGEVVTRVMTYEYFGYPKDFLIRERDAVARVTKEDVLAAARARLRPDQTTVMVLGNPTQFDKPLSTLGPVRAIDIAIPKPVPEKE